MFMNHNPKTTNIHERSFVKDCTIKPTHYIMNVLQDKGLIENNIYKSHCN
jgi:hypothetical protein